jgi:hypothetical protein
MARVNACALDAMTATPDVMALREVGLAQLNNSGRWNGAVVNALIRHASKLPRELYKSLTWDRGSEIADHNRFTVATDIKVYFCDLQHPWHRGSNENTNGLLRQYFPKGTDLSVYSQARLNVVARQTNERPRKTLNFDTPADRFHQTVHRPVESAISFSFIGSPGALSILRSAAAAIRLWPSVKAFNRRASFAPTGTQKCCSSAMRVIEHCTAQPRMCATNTTNFPSEETLPSAVTVLSIFRERFVGVTVEQSDSWLAAVRIEQHGGEIAHDARHWPPHARAHNREWLRPRRGRTGRAVGAMMLRCRGGRSAETAPCVHRRPSRP